MTYEPDQRVASAGTFTINKEDHTVGNLLRMQLLRDGDTRFAGYQLPHPLEHVCHVKVETAPGRAPVEVMGGAVTDLRQEVEPTTGASGTVRARARRPTRGSARAGSRVSGHNAASGGEGVAWSGWPRRCRPRARGRRGWSRPTPPPPAARRSWAS